MPHQTISFIGAGHMASALIGGLITSGRSGNTIWASCPNAQNLVSLQQNYAIHTTVNNWECANTADILVLAVIPQVIPTVLKELKNLIHQNKPLLISIAAGIEEKTLRQLLGDKIAIVRAMPNTPALVQCSATALYANPQVSTQQKEWAENLFNAVGMSVWLENEQDMFAVTALSGSGPLFFFLLLDTLQEIANQLKLPSEVGKKLLIQTALGSARMAADQDLPQELLKRIASPGGGTEQAYQVLQAGGFSQLVKEAVLAAKKRYEELALLYGK